MRRQILPLLVVAAIASALLGYGLERASVGTAYSDPFILLIPPASLIAAAYSPLLSGQRAKWGVLALCAIFAVKWREPGKIWGLSFGAARPLPAVAGLRAYYNLGRANELILARQRRLLLRIHSSPAARSLLLPRTG